MIERLRREFFDIRPGEWPLALGLSTYFFLVIAIFWVLKPIKRGLVISYFGDNPIHLAGWVLSGAQAEQLGKVLNMIVAFAVVGFFTWLVRRYARHYLIVTFCGIFGTLFLLFGSIINQIEALGDTAIWAFYVTGDIWTTVMVATFWAFANDLNTGDEAERLYGIVGLGGVVGGFVGATVVSGLVEQAGRSTLVFACILPTAVIGALAVWIHRRECGKCGDDPEAPCCPDDDAVLEEEQGSVFLEGGRLVVQSKYLLSIAAVLGLYEMVSNIVDFQLAVLVEQQITDGAERDAFFGLVGQATSLVSIGVQLFLTSLVMKRYSVKVALLFLPLAILGGTIGFVMLPTLAFVGFMSVSDNALNYSINQSAKEALYTPTTQDEKYKAKSFIDMFVQRAAKVASVALNLGLTALVITDARWLSLAVAILLVAWIFVIRFLGRQYEARKDADEAAFVGA
ncbi:NTP/NDP exchange transporter [Salinibacter altiplanensis]|uniref:NTP/NDP exchange transporter n=1 Tax=Salinibacter altiplanensis TaxID=1803181 RepID=UPI000C9F16C3|nr:Npt1/Npt2 family nucleotide transporter [Salinibacter altiplanensis]